MAISYPLTLPTTTGLRRVTITPGAVVGVTRSPFTKEADVQEHPGQRCEANVTLPPLTRAEFAEWQAFIMSLNGQEGTFTMGDPMAASARGSASSAPGTPLVKGASQTGQDLDIDGAPASATGYLKKMDMIQLGTGATARLYTNLVDADSDGSGNVTLTLWPDVTLANSPADNATVVVANAVGLWRLADNLMPWDEELASKYGITFRAISEI